jgi:ATP-dependent RNA helicase DDX19/DBP5
MSVVVEMGKFTPVTTEYAIKDHNLKAAKVTQHIVVGTPGTMSDLMRRRVIDTTHVKVLVLDEADNMLDQDGLGDHTIRVKKCITFSILFPELTYNSEIQRFNRNIQILLFSATFPEQVRKFASKFSPNANVISLQQNELSVEGIKQFYMDCDSAATKFRVLVELYNILTIGSSIIFCKVGAFSELYYTSHLSAHKKRDNADEIARRMTAEGHQVTSLHGAKDGLERDRIIDEFREGKSKVLITTNVASRGLDISQVNMVINYDMPQDAHGNPDWETYLHRVGEHFEIWLTRGS